MNKWKVAFISLLTICIFFATGCAYATAKLNIPNMGILTPKSWQSIEDPMYGRGYIHQFILEDKERETDYILIQSHYGVAITERK